MNWARKRTELTLDGTKLLLWCALEHASELEAVVAISVVDLAGDLLCSARMQDAPGVSADISSSKARTAAQLKVATSSLQQIVDGSRASYLSIASLRLASGGVPSELDGEVIGAIGASGSGNGRSRSCHPCNRVVFETRLPTKKTMRPKNMPHKVRSLDPGPIRESSDD